MRSDWRHRKSGTMPEPGEVGLDRIGIFGARTLAVGIVEAQDEAAALTRCEEPVQQSRARIADMDASGRRWRKADNWAMRHAPS